MVGTANMERLTFEISSVPLKLWLNGCHLKDFIEPSLKVSGRGWSSIEIDSAPAQTTALQLQFDMVTLWIRVYDAHGFALAKWKQSVATMEHEGFQVTRIQIELATAFDGWAQGEFPTFQRLLEIIPALRHRRRGQEQRDDGSKPDRKGYET